MHRVLEVYDTVERATQVLHQNYEEFLWRPDPVNFLDAIFVWQISMLQRSEFHSSLKDMVKYYCDYQISHPIYPNPKDFALVIWKHEDAHCESMRRNGVSANVWTAFLGNGSLAMAYIDVPGFGKYTQNCPIRTAKAYGEFLLAPKKDKIYRYGKETEFGKRFVQLAKDLKKH